MLYRWESPVGTFEIRPEGGGWVLWLDGEKFGKYDTPHSAAGDVDTQHSGAAAWDDLDPRPHAPSSLNEDWRLFR